MGLITSFSDLVNVREDGIRLLFSILAGLSTFCVIKLIINLRKLIFNTKLLFL